MIEFILYVRDQNISSDFYSGLLNKAPVLNVPGMTEFLLGENCKLGLMPYSSIIKILGSDLIKSSTNDKHPTCELYLCVNDLEQTYKNAIKAGATLLSGIEKRSWGDTVCYFSDPDGHIIAFAQKDITNQ